MFDEFRKSLKASLYERTASPIIGAFISAWLIFNWKLCLIMVIADDSIYERLAYIEKSPYIDIWPNLYLPVIAAAIFVGAYPLISLIPYMWWEWYAKKKAEIKNSMQRGILISLEKSIELRNEIDNQEAKFEEMLKGKEQKNTELLVMNDNLQKILEEKELQIKKLEQQLQKPIRNKPSKEATENASPKDTWPFLAPNIENKKVNDSLTSVIERASGKNTPSSAEKAAKEVEWDAEFDKIVEKNPSFPRLFDEALTGTVDKNHYITPETKKVCLVHGVIELTDGGKVMLTEKGQYMAKKIV